MTAGLLKKTLSRPTIVMVDIKELVKSKISTDFIKNTSEEELEGKFNELLQNEIVRIQKVARTKNVIILSKEAVLYGAPNITPLFQGQLKEEVLK